MARDEFPDIGRQRIINGNDVVSHRTNLRNRAAGRAGWLGAGEVPRKRLSAADVMQIVLAEIGERQSAAVEYDRLGHSSQAERLRREADVLAALLGPECGDAQPAR